MNILKKFWSWLSKSDQASQPVVEETSDKCCGRCACAPKLTEPSAGVAEFYKNEEGYAKAAYAVQEDTPVIATPVPQKKRKNNASAITAKKKVPAKTPPKKAPPKKPAPKKSR